MTEKPIEERESLGLENHNGNGAHPFADPEAQTLTVAHSGDDKTSALNAAVKEPNPDLMFLEKKHGLRPGDTYVRVQEPFQHYFKRVGPGHFVATPELNRPVGGLEKAYRAVKQVLIGHPLETSQEIHQRLNKIKALAVFGSDAISSCAYATEETLLVLAAAGSGALYLSQYTALAIALLLSMVAFSY